jgi:hypothetical protein
MSPYKLLMLLPAIAACASDPNLIWFEGAGMSYDVLEIGPRQYKITAAGAAAHKKEAVERGFMFRAEQICNGKTFSHDFQTSPVQYTSPVMTFSPTFNAFRTTGLVKCS